MGKILAKYRLCWFKYRGRINHQLRERIGILIGFGFSDLFLL